MEGYFSPSPKKKTGTLKIELTNIPQLKELIKKAEEEVNQLQKTIEQLRTFELSVELSVKPNKAESKENERHQEHMRNLYKEYQQYALRQKKDRDANTFFYSKHE